MIIAFIFILVGIIFLIGTLIYTKKKNNLQAVTKLDKANINKGKKTLKNLFQISNIENQIITIGNRQHSIIIELDSIAYEMLHNEEKLSVNRELISIAKMIKFPFQFLQIKQQINISDNIDSIKENTINANKYLKEYGNNVIEHLEKIQENQNLFERKNYMIISSFNNRRVAEIELKEFYKTLRYHLLDINICTRLINDDEIEELIYEQLHKGNKNIVKQIRQKGGLDLYVTGNKREKD